MKKQPLIILLSVVIVAALGYITYAIYQNSNENAVDQSVQQKTATKEQALEAARDYKPPENRMCITVMTPAVHKETGARYTFPSGCLPDGWIKDTSDSGLRQSEPEETQGTPRESSPTQGNDTSTSPTTNDTTSNTSSRTSGDTSSRSSSLTQEDVLAQARNYRPKGSCTTVMTPARHVATGTRYTFPSGCIPDGWVVERNSL